MAFDQLAAFRQVTKMIRRESSPGVGEGLKELLAYGRQKQRSNLWQVLSEIDYESSAGEARSWVQHELREVSDNVTGLWFGVYEVMPTGKIEDPTVLVLYVGGGSGSMDDSEWMCPLTWNMPPNAVVLPPLQALSEATGDDQDNDFHSDARYVIASAYVGLLVRDLAEELPRDIWLRGSKKKINVGAGFDEGEPVLMGTLSPKGLALRNPAT